MHTLGLLPHAEVHVSMPQHQNLLLIAARNPVPGQAKTRLGATIGMERAAQLYRAFLTDLAQRFVADGLAFDVGWAYTPESHPFRDTIGSMLPGRELDSMPFVMQEGTTWADRQAMLLRWGAEQGYGRTVLTASDSPQMSVQAVERAFSALETTDVVVGKVHDGGYYCVGVRGLNDVVSGVRMSTATAASDLIQGARARGLSVATIEPTFDLDVEADLQHLAELCRTNPNAAPMTCAALHELDLDAPAANGNESKDRH